MSSVEAFLTQWHEAHAGATNTAFGRLPVTMGGRTLASSYDALAEQVPTAGGSLHVVDLACGDGPLLARLADRRQPGLVLTGVDFSAAELGGARARLGERATLVQARAQSLPLAAASADCVLSHMALMLMDDAPRVLEEIRRVLRPQGVFAGVVGAGMAPTPAFTHYLEVLGRHARAPAWADVRFGDRRFRSVDGLRELLAPGFGEVRIDELRATQNLTTEALWAAILDMYDLHLLEADAREAVRDEVLGRIGPGPHEWTTTLRFFTGRSG
jgi:SAM-dependent methyltransferase